jgi:hypothetical protein
MDESTKEQILHFNPSVAQGAFQCGSKYRSIASRIFLNASSRVLPCDQQLFSAGQCATK